jgi:hypothetical protein
VHCQPHITTGLKNQTVFTMADAADEDLFADLYVER